MKGSVFVSPEFDKPWHAERVGVFSRLVRVVSRMERCVSVVVASPSWLSARRSADALLATVCAAETVSFDWVLACLDRGALVAPRSFLVPPDSVRSAALAGGGALLAGRLLVLSRQLDDTTLSAPSSSSTTSSSSSSLRSGPRLTLSFRDAALLAALHGARVVDPLGLAVPSHRGFSAADMPPQSRPASEMTCHVLVASGEAVSRLGMDVYESAGVRPVLMDWLVASIQSQTVAAIDKFEVYH